MLMKLAATTVQRFKYITNTPWSFSQTCTVTGAQDWIDQVLARPLAEHDDLTVYLWGTIEQDVRSVANGGDLTAQHDDAIIKMHLSPWDEGVGEGYHGVTTMEKKRAPGSGTARLKQKAREKPALEHIIRFRKRYKNAPTKCCGTTGGIGSGHCSRSRRCAGPRSG